MDTTRPTSELQLDFSPEQVALLTDAARECVRAAALGEKERAHQLPPELADPPVFGLFVTLNRGDELRACLGNWSQEQTMSLGNLIQKVARSTATGDQRFPRIHPDECDLLGIELSLMTRPEAMEEEGQELVDAIRIGTDGLYIRHPRGRGLLLPHVASKNGWDQATFLEQLCVKARLPQGAWRDGECTIERFETILLHGAPKTPEFDPRRLGQPTLRALVQTAISALGGEVSAAHPNLDAPQADEVGVQLRVEGADPSLAMARGKSLRELVTAAAAQVRGKRLTEVILLWHAIELAAGDPPHRHALLQNRARVAAPGDRVLACAAVALKVQAPAASVPSVRPAAVAGRFYPAKVDEVQSQLQHHLRFEADKETWRAILLPHAGWRYCGDVIGQTLAKVQVPRRVILIGPRHHPRGAEWSVAPHRAWQVPGAEIPIDQDLVGALCDAVPGLEREPYAHAAEHSSEVLLPFLLQLQPDLQVVPITIGGASFGNLERLGAGLQQVLDQASERPLVVISSDMNHFANEARNRELDEMALDAFRSGDPRSLFDVCEKNRISMCGMRPAAATMLSLAATGSIQPEIVAYDTSASTTGDSNRVVGYAGGLIR